MKRFGILSLLLCVLAFANATDNDVSSAEENLKDLAKAFHEKMNTTVLLDMITLGENIHKQCPDIENKFENTMDRIAECVEAIDIGSDTFCSLIRKNFVKCMKPGKELVIGCLPQESKDVPEMVEKMMMAMIDTACSSTVEEMLEIFNPCKFNKDYSLAYPPCKDFITILEENKNKAPTKTMICQNMPKMRMCVRAVLDDSCPNQITKTVHKKMYEAVEKAVKEDCNA